MATERRREIHARRIRRKKLHALREHLAEAKSPTEKQRILAKAARIAPWLPAETFTLMSKK